MTDKFHIGQRVRVVKSLSGSNKRPLATVVTQRHHHVYHKIEARGVDPFAYDITVDDVPSPSANGLWAAPEDWLEPLDDSWDKTTWDEFEKVCGWKPEAFEKEKEPHLSGANRLRVSPPPPLQVQV